MPDSLSAVESKTSVYTEKRPVPYGSFAENCSDHRPEKGLQAPEFGASSAENCSGPGPEKGLPAPECRSFSARVWPENKQTV